MSTLRLTRLSSSGVIGSFWRSEGELKRVIATSPSPEGDTFHFCWEVGGAVSAWRADSGSRDSLGGVEGAGEVAMLGDGLGLRFQMAILMVGLGGLGRVRGG